MAVGDEVTQAAVCVGVNGTEWNEKPPLFTDENVPPVSNTFGPGQLDSVIDDVPEVCSEFEPVDCARQPRNDAGDRISPSDAAACPEFASMAVPDVTKCAAPGGTIHAAVDAVLAAPACADYPDDGFVVEETLFIFDWDDTVLPSTWVQCQGLRLDEGSELTGWQRQQLSEVAQITAETLRIAKKLGTVVLVTNAERGWIELSCQKFMPTLYPSLENVKVLSARTTYESPDLMSPLEWKVRAFESEIRRIYGDEVVAEPERRKNVLSLGDSVHEREALLRVCAAFPNCRSKSLKFVERPDISQICKQHSLVAGCFNRIVNHDGNLDLCIRCA